MPVCSAPYIERIVMAIGIEKMNWETIKSFFWNSIVGTILISIVGFSWLGWVLESTAQQEATQIAVKSVNDRLAMIWKKNPAKVQTCAEFRTKQDGFIQSHV